MKDKIIIRQITTDSHIDSFPVLELANKMQNHGINVFSITNSGANWTIWGKASTKLINSFKY